MLILEVGTRLFVLLRVAHCNHETHRRGVFECNNLVCCLFLVGVTISSLVDGEICSFGTRDDVKRTPPSTCLRDKLTLATATDEDFLFTPFLATFLTAGQAAGDAPASADAVSAETPDEPLHAEHEVQL